MTETEQAHLDNIKKLWLEDGKKDNWALRMTEKAPDYACRVRDGKMLWFEYMVGHG